MTPHDDPFAERPSAPRDDYRGITAFVASAGAWPPDHETAMAGRKYGVRRVALQVGDPATQPLNEQEVIGARWADRWRGHLGAGAVEKWWRVNQYPLNRPPRTDWPWRAIANAEDDDEIERLNLVLDNGGVTAVFLLGKPHGPVPIERLNDDGIYVFAECFRENDASDHTITNSFGFFQAAGLDMRLWRPALQAFGIPFGTLGEQAREARLVGAMGIGVFTAENVKRREWADIGAAYGIH